ncbi:MAG: hypothetical protein V7K90_01070 [Nostoc sp.]|uniref:hypothetical protein n=1 Tax=Nostoc sp. TaxID=1180 RepID=UPI002FFCEBC3
MLNIASPIRFIGIIKPCGKIITPISANDEAMCYRPALLRLSVPRKEQLVAHLLQERSLVNY